MSKENHTEDLKNRENQEESKDLNGRRNFLGKAGLVAGGLLLLNSGILTEAEAAQSGQTIGKILEGSLNASQLGRVPGRIKSLTPGALANLVQNKSGPADGITLGELKTLTDSLVERFGANSAIKGGIKQECPSCCCCCSQEPSLR